MRSASARRAKSANSPGERSCTSKGNNLHPVLPFELFLRAVWPTDTAKQASRITGRSLRAVKYQLAGQAHPRYEDIVAMLRSEHGFEFLQHVMGEARPKWWRGVQKARGLGDMRRQLQDQQRRIAQLEMALD